MELDFVDCDNNCMEFECNIESNPPSSPDINDIVGAPQLNPRLGDEYQVEIPSMTTESEGLELIVNPAHSEAMNNKSLSFALGLPVPLIWIDNELEDGRNEGQEHFRNNHGAVNVHGPAETSDVKPNITSDNENELRPITFKLVMTEERKSCQQGQSRTYGSAPDKLSNSWSDADIKSFLLGLFIFGKNFIQIKRFLEDKGMGEILSFYYGKFYKSDEHVRWSDCRKIKRRKCMTGQKLFTGWRQHELLSRINSKVPGQVKDTLLQVSKSYAEGRASLQEYIFCLKSSVGLSTLVEAVAIGQDKADLTSFAAKPPRAPTGKGSSMEQRPAFAAALDNPETTKSVPKRPISDSGAAGINETSRINPLKRSKTTKATLSSTSKKSAPSSTSKKTVSSRTEIPVPASATIPAETLPTQTPVASLPSASPSASQPPPPPVPELPYGIIWREGVPIQLSNAIALPEHFLSSTKYDTPELQEPSNIEHYGLKCSELAQALTTLNEKYARKAEKLKAVKLENQELIRKSEATKDEAQKQVQAAEAARDQMNIELQKIKEDLEKEREALRKTNSNFDQLRKESAMDKKILEQSRSEAEKYLSNLSQLRAAMDSTREALVLKDEAIEKFVEESFENALKQIQLLNPDTTFNTSGLDCLSWVVDGEIVPLFPSADDASKSQLGEDEEQGEEAGTDARTPSV